MYFTLRQGKSMNHHPPIKILEYNYIADSIYIGTNMCCQTHFDESLRSKNIEADISLEAERIDAPFGINFYLWLPVKNDCAPTQDQLSFGASAIETFVRMKKKIYVHCQNGHSRAPTLVAAYFITQGYTVDQAIALIKSKRPSIHIRDIQKITLEDFKKSLPKNPVF